MDDLPSVMFRQDPKARAGTAEAFTSTRHRVAQGIHNAASADEDTERLR